LDNIYYSEKEDKYYLHDLSMAIRVPMTSSSTTSVSFPCGQEGCFVPPEVLAHCATCASMSTEVAAAPHVADHQKYCEERRNLFARDVWALGVAAYVLLTGSVPMERAVESDGCFELISREEKLVELYRQMLREAANGGDPMQESADEIDRVEGIEGEVLDDEEELLFAGLALVQKMLLEDPKQRIAVKDIVSHVWVAQTKSQMKNQSSDSESEATDAELELVRSESSSGGWKKVLHISTDCDAMSDCDSDSVMDQEGVVRDPSLMRVNVNANNTNATGGVKRKAAVARSACCSQRSPRLSSPLSSACSSPINLPKKRKMMSCM